LGEASGRLRNSYAQTPEDPAEGRLQQRKPH
jgi:hypothetical protein